jgi:hypothetical protein
LPVALGTINSFVSRPYSGPTFPKLPIAEMEVCSILLTVICDGQRQEPLIAELVSGSRHSVK